ncbi:MAG: LysR family transcriptional regulator [Gammaproteobacteria bacterium]|nr:LysR family transcriptional regulator [Gammaproteobacteria bacterium]
MRDLLSLKQLHYLVALAEHRNFTRAAEACFVTQSTLSAGLQELETQLGIVLVERDRRSVLLTDAGREVVGRASEILAQARDLVDCVGSLRPMSGLLRLGVIPTIAPFLLPRILPELRERYPDLRLSLREDFTAALLQRLGDGRLDFALIALPYDTGGLRVEPLFDDALWLVADRDDPAARLRRPQLTPALTGRLLLLEEGHCLRDHTLQACGSAPAHPAGGHEATSLLTLIGMVGYGLGVALVPALALAGGIADSSRLQIRELARPVPKRTIALVARSSSAREAELRALADAVSRAGKAARFAGR